jgi:uncharacterized protein (TIGR03435 family)
MLKNLVTERFKLALHFERKEVPGYELVVAKGGVKMKEAQTPKDNLDGGKARWVSRSAPWIGSPT